MRRYVNFLSALSFPIPYGPKILLVNMGGGGGGGRGGLVILPQHVTLDLLTFWDKN